jgi:glutamate racemase
VSPDADAAGAPRSTGNPAPIGIFDSGLGGLTVARALSRLLPRESLLYFADLAHVPYGPRPLEEIKAFALALVSFLLEQGAKAVIMGCNTSSAVALEPARRLQRQPIFGVIQPGVRAALKALPGEARQGRIAVIATQATVNSHAYQNEILAREPSAAVLEQACPAFVPLVEKGDFDGPEVWRAAREYLKSVEQFGAEALVFGCTQYPFLGGVIGQILGPKVRLVDPAEETVREVAQALREKGLLAPPGSRPARRYFASGGPGEFARTGSRLLGEEIPGVEVVNLWEKPTG